MTDFIFMVKGVSNMYITGPDVVKTVTGEEVTHEELGGALTHATKSGVATFVADDERACIEMVRYLLSFLPSNNLEDPPYFDADDDPERSCDALLDLIPDSSNQAVRHEEGHRRHRRRRRVLRGVPALGDEHRVRVRARRRSRRRASSATSRKVLAGCLDIDASEKAARFVRTCDAFNIPLVTFVDVPGFLPGTDQEYGGIIRHGAKLLYAYCEATVPRVQIITRKGYGGAYVVMNSKSIGADIAYAWPSAEIAVMGADGAVNIIFRKEIEAAADPEARRAELMRRVRRPLPQPVPGGRARLRRRRDRPARHPQDARARRSRCCARSASSCRRASTATRRFDAGGSCRGHRGGDRARTTACGGRGGRSVPRRRPEQLSMWVEASRRSAQRALLQRGPWRLSGRLGRRSRTNAWSHSLRAGIPGRGRSPLPPVRGAPPALRSRTGVCEVRKRTSHTPARV